MHDDFSKKDDGVVWSLICFLYSTCASFLLGFIMLCAVCTIGSVIDEIAQTHGADTKGNASFWQTVSERCVLKDDSFMCSLICVLFVR